MEKNPDTVCPLTSNLVYKFGSVKLIVVLEARSNPVRHIRTLSMVICTSHKKALELGTP